MSLLESLNHAYPAFANQADAITSLTVQQLIQSIDWNSINTSSISETIADEIRNTTAYSYLDPVTIKNAICQNNFAGLLGAPGGKLTIGPYYIPAIDYSYAKHIMYKSLIRAFTSYYHVRQHIGHKTIILDDARISILIDKFNETLSSLRLPNMNITGDKVINSYVVSFDAEFLGHKRYILDSCPDVLKQICLGNNARVGTKYGKMLEDITLEEYKIISKILDESDTEYYNYVQNQNMHQMCLPTNTIFDDILLN
jgi:hypothetical protein